MNLLKKNKWLIFLLVLTLVLTLGGFVVYQYVYQSHKTTEELNAEFTGTAIDFLSHVQNDFDQWNGKAIELSGKITTKDDKGIILNEQIYCQFREDVNLADNNIQEHQNIKIKGRVIGYDDLLEELKLDQCIIK